MFVVMAVMRTVMPVIKPSYLGLNIPLLLLEGAGVGIATAGIVGVEFFEVLKAECSMHSSPSCEV